MDVFALLFILSFIALLATLVVMSLYKKWKMKNKVAKGSRHIGWVSDMLGQGSESTELYDDGKMHDVIVGKTTYETFWDLSTDFSDYWVNTSEQGRGFSKSSPTVFDFGSSIDKWKKSLPHPTTRLKNRNKRKGKKK